MGIFETLFRRNGSANGSATRFGYDSAEDSQRRKAPSRALSLEGEDAILSKTKRRNVQATARDIQRNFSLAAWAIRRHLDYVSSFSFQAKTGDKGFDAEIEAFIEEWSAAKNCDAAGRHRLSRFLRIAEAKRTIDGDVFIVKTRGGKLQAIEADRVRNPDAGDKAAKLDGVDGASFVHGVDVDRLGRARRYAIFDRKGKGERGYSFFGFLPARFVFQFGFFDRFDQIRGISPIVAALNSFQDVYEGIDYALAKAKVSQILAFAFYRDAADQLPGSEATEDADEDGVADSKYKFDPTSGPALLDLDAGDRAEILESKTPSAEFQAFAMLVCQIALKSLDLPYSFFDESHTNFYGSRGGLIQYIKAAKSKRDDAIELRNDLTDWRLGLAFLDGELKPPRSIDPSSIGYEWIPDGVPFWDTVKETNGARMAIEAGFDSPQRVCRAVGTDFYENIDAIAEAIKYAEAAGVPLAFDPVPVSEIVVDPTKGN